MRDRFFRWAAIAALWLLGLMTAQPYIERLLFAATTPRPVAPRGNLADAERSVIELFERVSPSVVQIVGRPAAVDVQVEGNDPAVQSGTGFLWDPAGHVVTNEHVLRGIDLVKVRLASGEVVDADIVGRAANYDLGVVRLKGTRQLPPPLALGSSADLKVGQAAYAVGNPFGLDQSLTVGVISALKRRLPTSAGREVANVIQTDASINPGNSGGPLLDSSGRLIGVNTAILSPSGVNAGIGFAIPVSVVNRVVPELIRRGYVPTPGIGIIVADEAVTTRLGIEGVVVLRTMAGSGAQRAGMKGIDSATGRLGDVVVVANGKRVHRLADLTDQLEQVGVGRQIELLIRRDGREMSMRVDIGDVGARN